MIKKDDLTTIYDALKAITNTKLKNLKSLLKQYGFDLRPLTGSKNKYTKYEIVYL